MKWTPSLQWSQSSRTSLLLCVSYHSMVSWVPVLGMTNNLNATHWFSWTWILQILSFFRSYELLKSTLGHFYICYRLFVFKLTAFLNIISANTSVDQQITFSSVLFLCFVVYVSQHLFFHIVFITIQYKGFDHNLISMLTISGPYVIQAIVAHLLCVTAQLW